MSNVDFILREVDNLSTRPRANARSTPAYPPNASRKGVPSYPLVYIYGLSSPS